MLIKGEDDGAPEEEIRVVRVDVEEEIEGPIDTEDGGVSDMELEGEED